ncbi:CYFA0S05e04610g1_1 [Cyberlindnera fabianii]|uniref:CYFA0S05e04610g1_1 n=1 Tax=Cyberlindnera fabianii TaxID=36022 RepID=A0A061AUD7_CYBFA|nr:Mitochondrial inner membrane i-AAA protease supercomplex subunit MGR3 [Cyberlindnera fabianii]CDR40798.1 CYFA0S05e04610g1_1 [Cyberlindnera fabianii]
MPSTPSITIARSLATRNPRRPPQHFAAYRPRYYWTKVMLSVLGGLGVVSGGLWYFYWPHHTFSTEVAKILRKGLWAESERGGYDYTKALEYYIEALEQAQNQGLEPLCDEYTGIQLKIAEMYEKLSMNQDALMLYSEISAAYLDALTKPGNVPEKLRPHLIQKDLRVVIKSVELNSQNAQMCKMLLLTHLLVAQEEVAKRSATAANLITRDHPHQGIQGEREAGHIEVDGSHSEPQLMTAENIHTSPSGDGVIELEHNREAWEPFADELFNARDLFVAICLATGDIASAARAKTATTEWMIHADRHPGEILMSQTNLGSIMYLNAEAFEDKVARGKKEGNVPADEMNYNEKAKDQSLTLAIKCYQSVLDSAKKFPANLRQDDRLEESIALSTYGLGVIKLHVGELAPAKNLLRESRLRAKGAGFEDLVVQAEVELEKVNKAIELQAEAFTQNKEMSDEEETEKIKAMIDDAEEINFTVQVAKKSE